MNSFELMIAHMNAQRLLDRDPARPYQPTTSAEAMRLLVGPDVVEQLKAQRLQARGMSSEEQAAYWGTRIANAVKADPAEPVPSEPDSDPTPPPRTPDR